MSKPAARDPRHRPRRVLVVLLAVVTALGVTSCTAGPGTAHTGGPTATGTARTAATTGTAPSTARSGPTTPAPSGAADTASGPDGVTSQAVVAENARPGTTAWRITHQGPGHIEGFADHDHAQTGETVGLYVSTDQPSFVVDAYRMGWYGGAGARAVWRSSSIRGTSQPACPVDRRVDMVSCSTWSRSLSMPVTARFPAGDYLLKLTASSDAQAYVLLTVWQPSSHATYMVMNRSMVEQGWNTYGGYDFYQGQGGCILDTDTYPPCNRARVVSFDRPYAGDGSSDFLTNEYPLVAFMEQHGLDVTYCTDICVSEHPAFLLQHRALVGLDHDETWTASERGAALTAAAHGVNMAFFGAATLVRHARLEPSPLGADRDEVDYRNTAEDPLVHSAVPAAATGNTWDSPPTSWDATTFLGERYSGYLEPTAPNAAMRVYDASSWIFAGTGLTTGSTIPGVIGSDIDHLEPGPATPSDVQVLAHSPIPLSEAFTSQGAWNGQTWSDMTYTTEASGAGVLDSGDNIWIGMMHACPPTTPRCPGGLLDTMTGNVLRLFGSGPAGRTQPSRPNWQSVAPAGS